MRLCMFHPLDRPMERGWVGRIDGDRVTHLAAQTLQSLFLGGGGAREHAEYALADVGFLAPVLHPPTVRVFESQDGFAFANATAITSPDAVVRGRSRLVLRPRIAAVIGDEERLGGYTALAELRAPELRVPKDRDFALLLGPLVVTPDELDATAVEISVDGAGELTPTQAPVFDWAAAVALASSGTTLRPGDIVAAPPVAEVPLARGPLEVSVGGIGVLQAEIE